MRLLPLALVALAGCSSDDLLPPPPPLADLSTTPTDLAASNDGGAGRCADGVRDGDETDVDCGGQACSPCAFGRACFVDADCKSHLCRTGQCVACDFAFGAPSGYPAGPNPMLLATGDVDGDGAIDVAAANFGIGNGSTVSVWRGDGHGALRSRLDYSAPVGVQKVALQDLDGDGSKDLTVLSGDSFTVLRNDRHGNFMYTASTPVQGRPSDLVVLDVDGDARPDVITPNTSGVWFFRNAGGFQFAAPVFVALRQGLFAAVGADLNQDGLTDLVVGDLYEQLFYILLNHGAGNLQVDGMHATAAIPSSIAAADVDGDDLPDVVCANLTGRIMVFHNTGGAKFTGPHSYGQQGVELSAMALADLNADGAVDLLFASNRQLMMALNAGGTFPQFQTFPTNQSEISIAIADLDGDRRPDAIAGGNANAHDVLLGGCQ